MKFTENTTLDDMMSMVRDNKDLAATELAEKFVMKDEPLYRFILKLATSQFKMAKAMVENEDELTVLRNELLSDS